MKCYLNSRRQYVCWRMFSAEEERTFAAVFLTAGLSQYKKKNISPPAKLMTIDEFFLQHSTEEKDVSDRGEADDALWNQVVVCFGIFIGYN